MKVKYDHRNKFSNLSNWKEEACSLSLSHFHFHTFTFIYYRSSNMNYFIYTSYHFTHGKIWTQLIDLAPNVWLHSSVGRASHRYRGGHGFESCWSPDFFFQASSFQLLKLENLLRWSYFTFIYCSCWLDWLLFNGIVTDLNLVVFRYVIIQFCQ